MGKALYRKYRSKTLNEVIGQNHITDILSRALKQKSLSHAYLLTGPRGVGKTSVARILAYEINGLPYDDEGSHLDIIEIDAASNNGVEDVRDLREKVQIAPFSATKKVYIIDEVHMLSKAAFNALLKTLEEPPEHVIFILATTNIEKLPATIISRTQRFAFRPISIDDAVKHLKNIADKEKIKIDDDALKLIAQRGEGSFRDSISLLDQLSNLVDGSKTITRKLIEDLLGLASSETIDQILNAVSDNDLKKLTEVLNRANNEGVDIAILVSQLSDRIMNLISDQPQLIPLLDALIDVPKSPQPKLKLLSVLGTAISPKTSPKTAALKAAPLEVTASIKELEKQATKPKPSLPPLPKEVKKTNITKEFNWNDLIEHTKKNYIALYSVLSKCGHELDGDALTIYTCNNFYKKKLDDVKYSPLLSKCLQDIGCPLDIRTIPTTPPPRDSQAAAVAAIMGGGVEVEITS